MPETTHKTSDMLAQDRTDMALERTSMAADRTLMAWIRTSLSMISFGFTVFKFMEYMQREGKTTLIKSEEGAKRFGMTLISIGIISLVIACIQYWQLEKRLGLGRKCYTNLTFVCAILIGGIGFLALINAVFKTGPF